MKPLLILSIPNSGSTWFADLVAKNTPGDIKYFPEFFNPLRNVRFEADLAPNFGCETIRSYRNIADPGDHVARSEVRRMWVVAGYGMTKEVFSPFKMQLFLEAGFRVVVFLRSIEQSFPPSRLRVWSFYEHAWWALKAQGMDVRADSIRERAIEAALIMRARLEGDAVQYACPVVHWESLMEAISCGRLRDGLTPALGFDADQLAVRIWATRSAQPRETFAE
jgi:hypothetical protein